MSGGGCTSFGLFVTYDATSRITPPQQLFREVILEPVSGFLLWSRCSFAAPTEYFN